MLREKTYHSGLDQRIVFDDLSAENLPVAGAEIQYGCGCSFSEDMSPGSRHFTTVRICILAMMNVLILDHQFHFIDTQVISTALAAICTWFSVLLAADVLCERFQAFRRARQMTSLPPAQER